MEAVGRHSAATPEPEPLDFIVKPHEGLPAARRSTEPALPPSGGRTTTHRTSRALIFDRNFGPWFWGNLASNTGNWLFNVTAAVVVFELTESAVLVGLVSVAQFAARVVLSPWAGALSDRMNRRRLLLAGQGFAAASASALGVLAVLFGINGLPGGSWAVLGAAFGIGVGAAFAGPSGSSLIPALVEDVDLEGAVSLTQLTYNVGRALGPVGAGLFLVTLGPEAAFALNAVSFVAFIFAILFVKERRLPERPAGDKSVRAGLRHVRSDHVSLALLCGAATAGFAADPVMTLTPALAATYNSSDALVAQMVSAFGITATLASFLSANLQRRAGSARIAAVGMALSAAGLMLVGLAELRWMTLVGFAVNGAGFAIGIGGFTSLLQRRTPDALRGRIMALWLVAFLGNRPIAAVVNGTASDLASPRAAMVIAIGVSLIGLWLALRVSATSRESAEPPRSPT